MGKLEGIVDSAKQKEKARLLEGGRTKRKQGDN